MTDGVPQHKKRKAVLVMCGIVYVLNIVRLVVFYPIAVNSCAESPDVQACLTPMWQFHETVYTWGFLVVLVGMWLAWFVRFGGPARTLAASKDDPSPWRFQRRTRFTQRHWSMMGAAAILILLGIGHVSTNQEALDARDTLAFCEFSSELSSTCSDAQIRWDDAIGYAWSLSALGIGLMAGPSSSLNVRCPTGLGHGTNEKKIRWSPNLHQRATTPSVTVRGDGEVAMKRNKPHSTMVAVMEWPSYVRFSTAFMAVLILLL